MKRIVMNKYGFSRDEMKDFRDDGTSFQAYTVDGADRVRVTKAVSDGMVYISASLYGKLYYEDYKKLPHYRRLDKLNGVSINQITEDDLYQLAKDCIEYQKEYIEAENKIVYPDKTEVEEKLNKIKSIREKEYKKVTDLIKDNLDSILTTSTSNVVALIDYTRALKKQAEIDVDRKIASVLGLPESRLLMEDNEVLEDSWYYKTILERLKEIKIF